MNKYVDSGKQAEITATTAIKAGEIVTVVAGKMYGVSHIDIKAGDKGVVDLEGKFVFNVAEGATFAKGDKVYVAEGKAATSGNLIGIAAEDSANGEVVVYFDGLAGAYAEGGDESDSSSSSKG